MDNNSYLNEVVQQSALVEDQLRARQRNLAPAAAPRGGGGMVTFSKAGMSSGNEAEEADMPAIYSLGVAIGQHFALKTLGHVEGDVGGE